VGDATQAFLAPPRLAAGVPFLPPALPTRLPGRGRNLVKPEVPRPELDPLARTLIRNKARFLVGRAGFTKQDSPDLEQELAAWVLDKLRRFARKGSPCRDQAKQPN
jgi:hypothetical protein